MLKQLEAVTFALDAPTDFETACMLDDVAGQVE
jgi:hypothetical protein